MRRLLIWVGVIDETFCTYYNRSIWVAIGDKWWGKNKNPPRFADGLKSGDMGL